MRITLAHTVLLALVTFTLASCARTGTTTGVRSDSTTAQHAGTTAAVQADSTPAKHVADGSKTWRSLLENRSAKSWRGWDSTDLPKGWKVVDGVLSKDGEVDDLVTREEFANFELEFEWKLGKAGNSGLFYRGTREYDHIYWSAPEYQLLDDANAPDGQKRLTAAAAAYALYPAPEGVVSPFDQWNKSRIVVDGAHVEHWLNGKKVVEYELWSPDWTAKVKASKFVKYPNYGLAKQGYIGIQGDHPGTLSLRYMQIHVLP